MCRDKSEYIVKMNKKYSNCCAWISYYYLKNNNEIVNIDSVANSMGGNYNENLLIVKRILKGLGKKTYFHKVSLTYSDYLKLQKVFKDEKTYIFQLAPFIISTGALSISLIGVIFSIVTASYWWLYKTFFTLCILIILLIILWYINKLLK